MNIKASLLQHCRHGFSLLVRGQKAMLLRCGGRWIDTIEGDAVGVDDIVEVEQLSYTAEVVSAIRRIFGHVTEIKKLSPGIIGVKYVCDYNLKDSVEVAYVKADPWPDQDEGCWINHTGESR